jgi:membrane protease YdiL (CAAX protease family)
MSTTLSTSSALSAAAGTGVGWDSLAGMATLAMYVFYQRRRQGEHNETLVKNTRNNTLTTTAAAAAAAVSIPSNNDHDHSNHHPNPDRFPWHLPADNNRHKLSFLVAAILLTQAYFVTGQFSLYWEDLLYTASAQGWPLTAPMHRSLTVLLGHMSWVVAGSTILWAVPRPPPFWGKLLIQKMKNKSMNNDEAAETTTSSTAVNESKASSPVLYYSWFRSQWNSKWLWWAIGGYFVSSWLFNVADQVNQCILPAQVLLSAQESVVSQLVNPEHNDFAASVIGYIAPCLTAPVWEEILYRGFALAGLTAWTGRFHLAAVIQAVIFSAHHMSVTAALPLFVLGWTWAMLYRKSRNLFTVIFVHALWNSRVFLGSWLGL